MLKESVTYRDFNDQEQTEELYFNVSKSEVLQLMDLQPRMEAWQKKTSARGPNGTLDISEIREMLDIIKELIKVSYGERSIDGKHFRKSPGILDDFESSGAYDAFVFSLFENPERAVNFMINIMPADFRDVPAVQEAQAALRALQTEGVPQVQEVELGGEINTATESVPAYIRENREPTKAELAEMSAEELREAFRRKNQG